MTFRRVFSFFAALCAVGLLSTNASAAVQIFFSQVGPPVLSNPAVPQSPIVAPMPLTIGDRPVLNLAPGATGELHVWVKPDELDPETFEPIQNFFSVAIDVDSSNPPIAQATTFEVANPTIRNQPAGTTRWNGVGVDSVNTPPLSTDWVQNARGFRVNARGIGNDPDAFDHDRGRDNNTGSFYFGKLSFQVPAVVNGNQTTGLYFRVGAFTTLMEGGLEGTPAPLQFGGTAGPIHSGTDVGAGDSINNMALADAVLNVAGGPVGPLCSLLLTPHLGTDTTTGNVRLINPIPGEFRNANGISNGIVNIVNMPGQPNNDLTVYFDLVNNAQAQTVVDCLNTLPGAIAGLFSASIDNTGGFNRDAGNAPVTANLAIKFPGRGFAGSDQYIAFDFGANTPVAAVGVPEPSTFGMAGLGLIGLVGLVWKRRRAA